MMDLQTIRTINRERAEEAAAAAVVPVELYTYDWIDRPQIPYTGYVDPGDDLRILARYFVDLSGWGAPDEPALTPEQFEVAARELHKLAEQNSADGLSWALVECGQFQGHVEVYISTDKWFDADEIMGAQMWAGDDLEPIS